MIYPKAPFCPMNDDDTQSGSNDMNCGNNAGGGNAPSDEGNSRWEGRPETDPEESGENSENTSGGSNEAPSGNDNMPLWSDNLNKNDIDSMTDGELLKIIGELEFAVTDLNLFLDTHPDTEEALKTFTMLSSVLKSYKHDYAQKFGPLYVTDSSCEPPFDWVASENKWPWQA